MPVTKKKETYSEAMARLEKIVSQIDNNELEIDVLAEKIKEANGIIAFCSDKLTKADKEIEKLLSEKYCKKSGNLKNKSYFCCKMYVIEVTNTLRYERT